MRGGFPGMAVVRGGRIEWQALQTASDWELGRRAGVPVGERPFHHKAPPVSTGLSDLRAAKTPPEGGVLV
jgi:hypothetical protein